VDNLLKEANRIRKELGDVHITGSDQRPHGLGNAQERETQQSVVN